MSQERPVNYIATAIFAIHGVRSLFHQNVINELLMYFNTGETKISSDWQGRIPEFIKPRLLKVGEHFMGVSAVYRYEMPFGIKKAFVTFNAQDGQKEVLPWTNVNKMNELESHGIWTHTFSTVYDLPENLAGFQQMVLSPSPIIPKALTEQSLQEYMEIKRRDKL